MDVAQMVLRPDGGHYSGGFFSRLERGWASPPLWVYIVLAERFGIAAGRLLGEEEATRPLSGGEMTLVRVLRQRDIPPEEAIVRLIA